LHSFGRASRSTLCAPASAGGQPLASPTSRIPWRAEESHSVASIRLLLMTSRNNSDWKDHKKIASAVCFPPFMLVFVCVVACLLPSSSDSSISSPCIAFIHCAFLHYIAVCFQGALSKPIMRTMGVLYCWIRLLSKRALATRLMARQQ